MKEEMTVKILEAYFKPAYLLKSAILIPIHAGRAVAGDVSTYGSVSSKEIEWMYKNTIGDDTGENVSALNRNLCEFTVQYWAWKNYDKLGNPEYIGFSQYRRHLILNENAFSGYSRSNMEKAYSMFHFFYPFKNYLRQIGFTDEYIKDTLKEYDIILPIETDFSLIGISNLRDDYEKKIEGSHVADFDLMHRILKEHYPEMSEFIERQNTSPHKFSYMTYVVPKKVFFDYMEFAWPVIEELMEKIDVSEYSVNGKRTLGYLIEFLADCYFHFIQSQNKYRIKYANVTFIEKSLTEEELNKRVSEIFYKYLHMVRYKIMIKITIGKKRKKYKEKYKALKEEVKLLKGIRGEI